MKTDNTDSTKRKSVLITGANGFLGKYLVKEFSDDWDIDTLGKSPDNDYVADLSGKISDINKSYDLLIHAAGTSSEENAAEINHIGTLRLLEALTNPPRHIVFISSVWVYGAKSGTDIDETFIPKPQSAYGKSKLCAETELTKWCSEKGVILTILRPATIFGKGIHGKAKEMFDAIVGNRYFHIRGNNARHSIVMADDVAKAAMAAYQIGGVFNVTDGCNPTILELAESMAANYGKSKRIIQCPMKPIKICARIADKIPALRRFISSEKLDTLTSTLTYSNSAIKNATSIDFYNTIDVIARRSTDYPYQDND